MKLLRKLFLKMQIKRLYSKSERLFSERVFLEAMGGKCHYSQRGKPGSKTMQKVAVLHRQEKIVEIKLEYLNRLLSKLQ